MEQIEKDILHAKAGALLQLGMQIGAELQLTKENDRDQVMMQLLAIQRLVQMEGYSLDFAFDHFGYEECKRSTYKKAVEILIDVRS